MTACQSLRSEVREDFSVLKHSRRPPCRGPGKEGGIKPGAGDETKMSGGGSDANIFFGHGIVTGILGTGMKDMHTVRESVRLEDMVNAVELLLEIVRVHAEG